MAKFNYEDMAERAAGGWQRFCRGAMIAGVIAIVAFGIVLVLTT